jgi:hypothetical protein
VSGYSSPYFTNGDSASGAYTFYNDEADSIPANGVVDGKDTNDQVAVYRWYYDGNWIDKGTSDEAAVKGLRANALGLYDMSGNASEWCFTESTLNVAIHQSGQFRKHWFPLLRDCGLSIIAVGFTDDFYVFASPGCSMLIGCGIAGSYCCRRQCAG